MRRYHNVALACDHDVRHLYVAVYHRLAEPVKLYKPVSDLVKDPHALLEGRLVVQKVIFQSSAADVFLDNYVPAAGIIFKTPVAVYLRYVAGFKL